jgi:hypothetical protein
VTKDDLTPGLYWHRYPDGEWEPVEIQEGGLVASLGIDVYRPISEWLEDSGEFRPLQRLVAEPAMAKTLTRFAIWAAQTELHTEVSSDGEWVRYEDMKHLLAKVLDAFNYDMDPGMCREEALRRISSTAEPGGDLTALLLEGRQWIETLLGVYRHRGNASMAQHVEAYLAKLEHLFPPDTNAPLPENREGKS